MRQKPFTISKFLVKEAYQMVKDNAASAGRGREAAVRFLIGISKQNPTLFHHWKLGMTGVFV